MIIVQRECHRAFRADPPFKGVVFIDDNIEKQMKTGSISLKSGQIGQKTGYKTAKTF